MKTFAIVIAVGAAALIGGPAANAAENTLKAKSGTEVTQQSTDFSSRKKRHVRKNYGVQRHTYRHYRPRYGSSYGHAPRPYYGGYNRGYRYGHGYGHGGPSISFGFGGGRW
jgi:hypothetical protein